MNSQLPNFKLRLFTLFLFSALPLSVYAKNLNSDALYQLTLADLMKIKVTTASKFEQSLHDSHASLSIINRQQIEQFGGQNLFEVLERIVSVNSNFGVLTSITTRGSKPWTSLAQHLGLINGRPFGNMSGAHSLYTSIPLTSVERIEYIRGPGSVLYGTNAYQGVFNIVTKQAIKDGWQANQRFTVGSFNSRILDGSAQYRQGDFDLSVGILLTDVDGWKAEMFDPVQMQFYSRDAFQKEQTIHLDASYQNLSFSVFNSQQQRFGNYWDAPEASYIPWSKKHPTQVANLSHDYQINTRWRIESHLTYIKKTMEWSSNGVADEFIRIKSPFTQKLLEINVFGQLSENSDFLMGGTFENRKIFDAVTVPDSSEDYASAYFQFQHQVLPSLSYMIGGQYVTSINLYGEADKNADFVPRLGLIYDFAPDWAVKVLHGQAYRQPTAGERSIETPGVQQGSPDLDSETITTNELQLFYQVPDLLFTLTWYHSEERNLILLVPTEDENFPLKNQNQGELTSKGLELEFKYDFDESWYVEFSATHQKNKNGQGVNNTNLSPNNSWKLGIGYNIDNWRFGLYNLHYSDYHDNIFLDPNREIVNPPANGYDWLTFKVHTELVTFASGASLDFSLEFKNILDEKVYQPNDTPVFYPINTLPAREQRGVFATITYRL
ncbi:TonB-dependent receptor plug domain-containing protein [Thalassotalea fusca]